MFTLVILIVGAASSRDKLDLANLMIVAGSHFHQPLTAA